MKRILKYLNGYKKETFLAPLFKMLEALLELLVPVIVRYIIDVGIAGADKPYIAKMCGLLALIAFVGLGVSVTAQYFAAQAAVGASAALRRDLLAHTLRFSYADTDAFGASTLISRLTGDVDQIQNGINLTLRLLLRSPFAVFGAMIAAFAVDKTTALTFVAVIPALFLVVAAVMAVSLPLYNKVREGMDGLIVSQRSALNGVRVIRAFGREQTETRKFREKNGRFTAASIRAGNVSALINPMTYVLVNVAIIVLIHAGALRVSGGAMTQGEVVAQYNYMTRILVELIKLANLIVTITKSIACANRVAKVLETAPSMTYPETGAKPDETAPAVELHDAGFTYPGAQESSLEGVSLTVGQGERIGVIGATGSGKTTLVNLIPRFFDATQGSVKLFGHDVKAYSEETLNRLVAVTPQKATLFRGTIRENLQWGDDGATDDDLTAAARAAQAADVIAAKSGGLDEPVEENGRNFSGGQRQRLTVARALVKKAPILILDDAASALDLATESRLRKALAELPERPTVFTVSQRVSSVKGCDRILVAEDGKIAGIGTHETLLTTCPAYREICESQGIRQESG